MEPQPQTEPRPQPPLHSLSSQHLPPPPPPPDHQPAAKKPKMSSTSDDETSTPTSDPATRKPRYKRRKVAIFFAYCGVGYQGMQKNPGAKTIEGDMEEALYLSGAVPEPERGQPKRWDWARSARTDKGVSAVGQVVSGRFYVDPPGFVERLNANLSSQIRVFGFTRVTNSFNAKKFCDRRRYVYLVPVFALDKRRHRDRESVMQSLGSGEELVKCGECSERGRKVVGAVGNKRDGFLSKRPWSEGEGEVLGEGNGGSGESGVKDEVADGGNEGLVQSGISSNSWCAVVEEGGDGGNVENGVNDEVGSGGNEVLGQSGGSGAEIGENEKSVLMENHGGGGEGTLKNDVGSGELGVSVSVESELLGVEGNGGGSVEVGTEEKGELRNDGVVDMESNDDDVNAGEVNGNGESGESEEFKYDDEVRERFNRILKYYEGTHNFHNFTTRTKAEDPAAKRYIVSFTANTVVTVEGIDFVKCEVVGQSFMLHQIRKMMGMAVAVMRDFAPESIFQTAFNM